MKAHGGLEVQLHSFLTSALDDMSVHLWVSAPNIHSAEGWMGHLADLDALENRKTCCPCWESNHNSLVIHYTDYSSPASIINKAKHNINMNFPHIHTHTHLMNGNEILIQVGTELYVTTNGHSFFLLQYCMYCALYRYYIAT